MKSVMSEHDYLNTNTISFKNDLKKRSTDAFISKLSLSYLLSYSNHKSNKFYDIEIELKYGACIIKYIKTTAKFSL